MTRDIEIIEKKGWYMDKQKRETKKKCTIKKIMSKADKQKKSLISNDINVKW
jgi:hypothetical protein